MLTTRTTVVVILLYAAPLVMYALLFGPSLSESHTRWSEFGSAMAGIYAPIVALTTLAVLVRQTRLQGEINNHQYEQAYIVQSRADIDFYALQLAESLKAHAVPGVTIRDYLHRHFQAPNLKSHDNSETQRLAVSLDQISPQVMGMWAAIYSIIGGLETKHTPIFEMTLRSSLQRLIALLSFETCVCLENFHRIRCGGELVVPYKFSPSVKRVSAA